MDISLLTRMFYLNCIRETNEATWARENAAPGSTASPCSRGRRHRLVQRASRGRPLQSIYGPDGASQAESVLAVTAAGGKMNRRGFRAVPGCGATSAGHSQHVQRHAVENVEEGACGPSQHALERA